MNLNEYMFEIFEYNISNKFIGDWFFSVDWLCGLEEPFQGKTWNGFLFYTPIKLWIRFKNSIYQINFINTKRMILKRKL